MWDAVTTRLFDDVVAMTQFGEGTSNQGEIHEAMNFAGVHKLPVIFVCENNLYGEFTSARETCLLEDLADRAAAYGIPGHVVDGNDVEAVFEAASVARTLNV